MRSPRQRPLAAHHVTSQPLARVVVGIDFSEVSLATAQWVGRHLAREATLTLVHVIADPLLPNVLRLQAGGSGASDGPFQARMQSLRGALRGLAAVVGGAETRVEVRVGDPALQLAAYADIVGADLVVVGGSSAFHAAPRGDTATTDRLLRHLARPGLVVRNVSARPGTVVAAIADNTEESVLALAQSVASPCSARVGTIRVPSETRIPSLETGRHPHADDPVASERAQRVIDAAGALRADIIVIARDEPAPGVDDDVARLVARTATCSVLIVPQSAAPGFSCVPSRPWPGGFRRTPTTRRDATRSSPAHRET